MVYALKGLKTTKRNVWWNLIGLIAFKSGEFLYVHMQNADAQWSVKLDGMRISTFCPHTICMIKVPELFTIICISLRLRVAKGCAEQKN
jgi:hypothetical protein